MCDLRGVCEIYGSIVRCVGSFGSFEFLLRPKIHAKIIFKPVSNYNVKIVIVFTHLVHIVDDVSKSRKLMHIVDIVDDVLKHLVNCYISYISSTYFTIVNDYIYRVVGF